MADDTGSASAAIEIKNVEDADFTINRYTVEDGEVIEQEVEATISDDDIAAFGEEVEAAVDDALADHEIPAEDVAEDLTTDDPAPEDVDIDTDDADEDGDSAISDALPVARTVVREEDITKEDWAVFAEHMRERDIGDQSLLSDVWAELKNEGLIERPDSEQPDGPGDENGDGGDESLDVDESEPEGFEDADTLYLAIEPGDADSDAAIDQFDSMIQSGEMETLNVQSDVDAPDMLEDAGVSEDDVPVVLLEADGDLFAWGEDVTGDGVSSGGELPEDAVARIETDVGDIEGIRPGDDIMLVNPDAEASDRAIEALMEPIQEAEVIAEPVGSDVGSFLVEPLPDDVELPVYFEVDSGGFTQRPLEVLFGEYT